MNWLPILQLPPEVEALRSVWQDPVTGLGTSGMSLALTIVMTLIFAIAVFYMLATAMRNERLKRWLVGELMQAFASALMIVGIVAIALFISQASLQLVSSTTTSQFQATVTDWGLTGTGITGGNVAGPIDYLQQKLVLTDALLDKEYQYVVNTNMHVERAEWTCFIFFGVEIKCGWDLHPKVEALHALAYKLVQLRIAVNAEMVLVQYILANFLSVLLPIGIVLRALPFTRGAGGLIIAIVLGFYFVFPLLFTLSDLALNTQLHPPSIPAEIQACVFNDNDAAFAATAADLPFVNSSDAIVGNAREMLVALILDVILMPLLILAATVLFIRAISPMLGSESQDVVYGISKLL
ncbi:MAG: hypothetical protein WC759_02795 [Candidatus Micrarchaeia archaeon]|jgi:hypothetical protein